MHTAAQSANKTQVEVPGRAMELMAAVLLLRQEFPTLNVSQLLLRHPRLLLQGQAELAAGVAEVCMVLGLPVDQCMLASYEMWWYKGYLWILN